MRDSRGTVAVIGALSLVAVIGSAAFAVDLNRGYDQRIANQRAADMGALAAALAYKAANSEMVLAPTAQDVVLVNGIADATVTATLVNDVPTAGTKAVKVTVTTRMPFALGTAMGFHGAFDVGATAYASLNSAAQIGTPCILSLASSGTGISTSGGATINTPDCVVAAVSTVENGGTGITAKNIIAGTGSVINNYGTLSADLIRYGNSFTNPSWNTNVPSSDKIIKGTTDITDPLADNVDLANARELIGSFVAPRTLANPVTPAGAEWTIGWTPSANVAGYRSGTSANYTIPAGNYTIGKLTIDGGLNVRFASGSNITVANGVSIGGGSTVVFGDVNLKVNGGFASGSSGVTLGNGTIEIGSGSISFNGTNSIGNGAVTINSTVNLGGGSSLSMGTGNHAFQSVALSGGGWMKLGDGDLDVGAGIAVGGGSTLAAGKGDYRLGKASSGDAVNLSGSAVMLMGDGAFSANGNITTSGGSRLVFGKTTNHLINGNMTIAGSVLFGTSRYTIADNFTNGTGGTTWPYTSSVTGLTYGNTLEGVSVSGYDMAGVNVSFILSGTLNLGGGAKTKLVAAAIGTSGGAIADLLIESLTRSATSWGAGAQNIFVGAVHLPNSDVTMSGGSTTLSAGQCFMLIANRIAATGGAATGSACTSITGGGSSGNGTGSIGLVQ